MSRSKKMSHTQKMRARVQREVNAAVSVPLPPDDVPPDDVPPEAVEAYFQAFQWAGQNPEKAADLMSWDEGVWAGIMAGMAFPEKFGFPQDEVDQAAGQLRTWNILHGFKYTMDWPVPVAMMSNDDIIAAIRADAAAGKISLDPNE